MTHKIYFFGLSIILFSLLIFSTTIINAVGSAGDANGDNKVDTADYAIWLNNYNQTTANGNQNGDFNNDTKIDGIDYIIWLTHFGQTPSTGWSGPKAQIVWREERPKISIISAGGTEELYDPFWLSIGTQETADNWQNFDYAVKKAKDNGVSILEVNLGWQGWDSTPAGFKEYADHLQDAPKYLIFRFDLNDEHYTPFGMTAAFPGKRIKYTNLAGDSQIAINGSGYDFERLTTHSDSWATYHNQVVQKTLKRLDELLPGRVIGARIGEYYNSPKILSNGFLRNVSNDQKSTLSSAYFPDYSDDMIEGFCNWQFLPNDLKTICHTISPNIMNTANYGENFIQGISQNSNLAIYFNRYQSTLYAQALAKVGAAAHEVSGGKALSASVYGYLNALEWEMPSSSHTALDQLEHSYDMDFIGGPYSYAPSVRNLGTGMSGEGVIDSASLYPSLGAANGRIYLHEDDTRTYFCAQDVTCSTSPFYNWYSYQNADSLLQTLSFMRRNIVSSALRKNGLYFLDLWHGTVYANRTNDPVTSQFWQAISDIRQTTAKVSFVTPQNYVPEVAVFTDEMSYDNQPLVGSGRNRKFQSRALEQISSAGLVYREYLLSDLLSNKIPLDKIKLAIFLNAYKVPDAVASAIKSKLENNNRSLVFIYAAGLFGNDWIASDAKVSAFTGITIKRGDGALPVPATTVLNSPVENVTLPVFGIDDSQNGNWDPWFYVDDPQASSLGHYTNGTATSLASKQLNGYTAIYSALPDIPSNLYRYWAKNAGVHLFTDHLTDEVEAGGNSFLVNVKDKSQRTFTIPFTAVKIVEDRNFTSTVRCTNCSSFTFVPDPNSSGPDTYTYRWE